MNIFGLLDDKDAVEDYLVDRAEKALERADAGGFYTHEDTKQLFADKIQELRQGAIV